MINTTIYLRPDQDKDLKTLVQKLSYHFEQRIYASHLIRAAIDLVIQKHQSELPGYFSVELEKEKEEKDKTKDWIE